MRWIIIGAGAIGGVIGARLFAAGHQALLVARGPHLASIQATGLRLMAPDSDQVHRVDAVGSVAEVDWRPGDVAALAVKSMDTDSLLAQLAACAPPETPVLCVQNGVANEPTALRLFSRVYGCCAMLPTSHLEPGVVVEYGAPVPGTLRIGRFPAGVDALADAMASDLRDAGFEATSEPDITRWKYAKLLLNLSNAVDALCGPGEGSREIRDILTEEGEAVLNVAGVGYVPSRAADSGEGLGIRPVAGVRRPGGSTWQSLARGTRRSEVDYLNGEIVLLGRLHGIPTPANEAVRDLVNQAARRGTAPGSTPVGHVREAIAEATRQPASTPPTLTP